MLKTSKKLSLTFAMYRWKSKIKQARALKVMSIAAWSRQSFERRYRLDGRIERPQSAVFPEREATPLAIILRRLVPGDSCPANCLGGALELGKIDAGQGSGDIPRSGSLGGAQCRR